MDDCEYDLYTFNKMVDSREQLTIQFYVDDLLKASYKDQKVLDDLLNDLQNQFGQEDK